MNKSMYFISEAAKEVKVENHVLRYWEEELNLPVKRNEQGHRFYTTEDLERFRYVKELKEQGLQLKAIRNVLEKKGEVRGGRDGDAKLMVLNSTSLKKNEKESHNSMEQFEPEDKADKAYRLQMLLKAMIADAMAENNSKLCEEIKETVQKELDYQFRMEEEREAEREKERIKREEEHYEKLDIVLREKSVENKRKKHSFW